MSRLTELDLYQREHRKFLHCFDHVHVIIFIMNCSIFNFETSEFISEPGVLESMGNFQGVAGSL